MDRTLTVSAEGEGYQIGATGAPSDRVPLQKARLCWTLQMGVPGPPSVTLTVACRQEFMYSQGSSLRNRLIVFHLALPPCSETL